ncbi:MAG TPA: DUF1499 domain-containing protein [Candidatus Binataceae bacterium]
MIPAWLAFFDALLAVALVAAGVIAAHFYLTAPFIGFQMFAFGFLLSILGTIVGIIGIIRTGSPARSAGRNRAVVGTVISLAIALPIIAIFVAGRNYPPINDITTDFDHPPEFVVALTLAPNSGRDMKYDKDKYAARQTTGYPAPLAPLKMDSDPAATFEKVKAAAAQMPNWQITATDPKAMTIEGVSTSKLFHFDDDFIIQVRPADGGGSLVEMRSKSRVGVGDFGVNYTRIATFFARLKGAGAATGA